MIFGAYDDHYRSLWNPLIIILIFSLQAAVDEDKSSVSSRSDVAQLDDVKGTIHILI